MNFHRETNADKCSTYQETVYDCLLRVYDVKDDLTKCTIWQMVKDRLFTQLEEEKWLMPF